MIWGVLAAVAVALSLVVFLLVRPLWSGATEGGSQKEQDGIGRRRRLWAIALVLALPVLAGLLYWQLGGVGPCARRRLRPTPPMRSILSRSRRWWRGWPRNSSRIPTTVPAG